jgi:hypothetical protein
MELAAVSSNPLKKEFEESNETLTASRIYEKGLKNSSVNGGDSPLRNGVASSLPQ